jgi:hypothetical protein
VSLSNQLPLNQPGQVRHAWLYGEVIHLVAEKEASPRRNHATRVVATSSSPSGTRNCILEVAKDHVD